jgi:rhodanese-related sulfurtransferase
MRVLFLLLAACGDAPGATAAAPAATEAAPASAAASAPASVVDVDVAGLREAMDAGAVRVLVDVRTPDEFASGHVSGARNIPVDDLDARLSELGAPGEVYVICRSGGRSARASKLLASRGFSPRNVLGGTEAWKAAGLAVE